ncbi:MAG: hypothetical protein K2I06_09455 [Ruminococcus sp.]|nr:hypothetical protein [Ruminococcus sp.]
MKKKLKIIIPLIIAIVLLVPIKECYRDGGTIKYNAVLWSVTKHHSIAFDSEGRYGYNTGITVRILCFDVYSDYPKFILPPQQKGV